MKNLKQNLLLLSVILFITSCRKSEPLIYRNESIEFSFRQAQEKKQKICLILIDERDTISRVYMERLETVYQSIVKETVFNVIDITHSENRWYKEWINSSNYPVTCIFSEEEKLVAIIGGASTHSFNSIKMVLNDDPSRNDFGYKSTLTRLDFNILSVFLDDILKCKTCIDRGEDCDIMIDKTLDIVQYPFNIYLKYKNEINQNKNNDATNTAHRLLEFQEDIRYIRVYADMFKEVMRFINPHNSSENNPILTVRPENVILRNCTLYDPVPFQVTVKNTGYSILQIKKIDVGCGCIVSLNKDTANISPNEENVFKFTFTPDNAGEIVRTITFLSNAANSFEEVDIIAYIVAP